MPVSRSPGHEARRRLLLLLAAVIAIVATNTALFLFAQCSVAHELDSTAATLAQRIAQVLARSHGLADEAHRHWLGRASPPCDDRFVASLGKLADSVPYVKGISVLQGATLACTSLSGMAQAQTDRLLDRLLVGDNYQAASPLNLGSAGLVQYYPYADGFNILSIMSAEYFFDLLRTQDPARYRLVVLRVKSTYLRSDLRVGSHLPAFRHEWGTATAPGGVQVYVEADGALWWQYVRDSVVTWNLIVAGVLWVLLGFCRRLTSNERAFDRALRKAVTDGTIVPYYQPLFDLPGQVLSGVEVLARWPLPDGRFVPPDLFIARAEKTGVIGDLTRLLIDRVIADLPALQLPWGTRLALNLPPELLDDAALFAGIEYWGQTVRAQQLQPVIEVTERSFVTIAQTEQINALFGRLRRHGIQVALDDFGAEYSSLGYLHRFHFDYVKIDGLFLDGIGKRREVERVLDGVLNIAASLGLKVVVEKVETPVQLAYLNDRKVGAAQGYYFGRPVPIDAWRAQAGSCARQRGGCGLSVAECEQERAIHEVTFPCPR
ncbi:EAL domain-containing protein [Jeongeupia chitinilytica]|uniref:cyclic-guanylate-specific phosphodiesterase n=1 Tax=Jeongeupia chitinilytica TaxID=1041641 RepID=A0ABQ3GW63_9NEIS|nr:cyclic diguanylate phosphodiesterase [Jeongeupia chitinilytica]GHD58135.1 hypothetical protein GCM10007350_07570 [Jeongeupia chitinilytica]